MKKLSSGVIVLEQNEVPPQGYELETNGNMKYCIPQLKQCSFRELKESPTCKNCVVPYCTYVNSIVTKWACHMCGGNTSWIKNFQS